MVGGSSKIPIVEQSLRNEFNAQIIDPDAYAKTMFDSQLMVVAGSAIIGGSLSMITYSQHETSYLDMSLEQVIIVHDVLPMDLGFEVCAGGVIGDCGIMYVVIERHSKYPANNEAILCSQVGERDIILKLFEGDRRETKDNIYLSQLKISDIAKRKESDECNNVKVELSVDANGICKIEADVNGQKFEMELSIKSEGLLLSEPEIHKLRKK
eukprot:243041_1